MQNGQIIGSGLLATTFEKYQNELQDTCIFASGVSNSLCTDESAFKRESVLLERTLETLNRNTQLIYFSTCSTYDLALNSSKYVLHKKAMEIKALQHDRSLIFRLPQLAGNSSNKFTLLNYLSTSIENGATIKLWKNAKRNIIDVEDAVNAMMYCMRNDQSNRTTNNICNPTSSRVLDIVRILEEIKGKEAQIDFVEGGGSYQIPLGKTAQVYEALSLTFPANYLKETLRKYYAA